MSRTIRYVNLGILILVVVLAGLAYWRVWRPLPTLDGEIAVPVSQSAQVVRDEKGVPHITAANVEDALFLQGYVHAQDRLWQMDALRRLAAGELSEIIGVGAVELDQESRRLQMRRSAESQSRSMPAEDRRLLAAYARGVNHFMETHRSRMPVEFSLLGYDPRPWTIVDSILVGLQMFRSLTSTWKDEVLKQSLLAKGDAQKVAFLFPVAGGDEVQLGSNSWVVSGKLTATGKPILANDTHLEWSFPGPWYSNHLKTPELDVIGFSLAGLPCVIIGHNQRIAWGITNLHFDVQDLYLERLDPQSGRYLYKGQLEQAQLVRETIVVKGSKPIHLQIYVTRHGPIFRTAGNAQFAIRWSGLEPGAFQFPFLEIGQAKNWEEFRKALSRLTGPASNLTYADVDGNIGYQAVGKLPARKSYNGDLPTDGGMGETEWDGWIPFEEMPSAYNPPSGMLVTANQNPFREGFAHRVNGNFSSPYRSRQIEARLKARTGWKPEEMLGIQTDVYSAFSHQLAQEVVKAWQARGQGNADLREAGELLKNWNGQMQPGMAAPLVVTLIYQHVRKTIADRATNGQGSVYEYQMAPRVIEKVLAARSKEWFEDFDLMLLKCFSAAVDEGKKLQGTNVSKWDYGRYTEFTLSHPVIGRVPYLGRFFNLGPMPMAGASTTVKQTSRRLGPSMRFIADLSNWENSLHNTTIGQSGQPLSAHFRDQWDAYYSGRSFPMQYGSVGAKHTLTVKPLR